MRPDLTQRELIRQITARWEHARQQLEKLKAAVRQQNELANARLESNSLKRELDLAYRALGEAVWAAYKKGTLKFPNSALPAARAVKKAEADQKAYVAQIQDLLNEGLEAVDRQSPRLSSPKTLLANRPKKR